MTTPRFAADGEHLAWASGRDGGTDIYLAGVADGVSTRLSHWAASWAVVCGWTTAGEVLAASTAAQPFGHYTWARALGTEIPGATGSAGLGNERVLPFGPVADLSFGRGTADGTVALLNGTLGGFGGDPAHWKRYRGGTAGRLWVGPVRDGRPAMGRRGWGGTVPPRPGGSAWPLRRPMIAGGRLAFISDHEGTGNVYSCALDGSELRRHTDHDGWYARQASTDGQRIIYACGGELWLLDSLDAAGPRRLDIVLGSPASGRAPRLISADDHVGSLSVDGSGTASAVEVRGTVHWLTHRDGPARALSVVPGVRARYPQVLGSDGQVVWATDADGIDAVEIGGGDPAAPAAQAGGRAGRPHQRARGRTRRQRGRRRRAGRAAAACRRRLGSGTGAHRLGQRPRDRAGVVTRLGLAGLVGADRASRRDGRPRRCASCDWRGSPTAR